MARRFEEITQRRYGQGGVATALQSSRPAERDRATVSSMSRRADAAASSIEPIPEALAYLTPEELDNLGALLAVEDRYSGNAERELNDFEAGRHPLQQRD